MEVSISARHGTLQTDAHDYIVKKLPKLQHLFDKIQTVKVTVDFQPANPEVELVVSEPRQIFVCKESQANVQAAFDSALAKMEGQLRKHKEKLHNHHSSGDKHTA